MMRSICLLAAAALLLCACAASSSTGSDSRYRCDRNGEREQRAACEP